MTHQDTSNGFSSLSLRYLPHNRTLEDIGRQELGGSGAGGGGASKHWQMSQERGRWSSKKWLDLTASFLPGKP